MPDLLAVSFLICRRRRRHCRHGARLRGLRRGDGDDAGLLGAVRAGDRRLALPAAGDRRRPAAAAAARASYVDWRRIGLLLVAAVVGRAARQSRADPGRARADALGDLGHRARRGRAAGERLALPRPAAAPATTLAAGVISGFLNGLSGMAGPPIAFYYLAGNETVERVRANLTTYFVFVDLRRAAGVRRRAAWCDWDTGVLGLCLAPAVIAGRPAGRAAVSAGQREILSPSCTRPVGRRGDRVLDPVSGVA